MFTKSSSTLLISLFVFLVFLIPMQTFAATLYYFGYAGGGWDNLGNWYLDSGEEDPAASLPVNGDTVYLIGNMLVPPAAPISLAAVYVADPVAGGNGLEFNGTNISATSVVVNNGSILTGSITGSVVLNSGSSISGGSITGDVVLNGGSEISNGSITGNLTINSSGSCTGSGTITGNLVLNGSSHCHGVTISGNVTFNTTYYDTLGVVPTGGILTISGQSIEMGSIGGIAYTSDSQPVTSYVFSGAYENVGIINNNVVFNGDSSNQGTITGGAIFNDASLNSSTTNGVATFNNTSQNALFGRVVGSARFNGTTRNIGRVIGDATFNTTYYGSAPSAGIFSITNFDYEGMVQGTAYGSDNQPITQYVFSGSLQNLATIFGNVTFNDTTYNYGYITGNIVFNDSSFNSGQGTTTGNVIFNDNSHNEYNIIVGDATFNTTYYNTTAPHGGIFTVGNYGRLRGKVIGNVYGSDGQLITGYIFHTGSNLDSGTIYGNAQFNDTSENNFGTINGNAIFNDSSGNRSSVNIGSDITGYAVFNDTSIHNSGSSISGDACFAPTATQLGGVFGTVSVCTDAAPTVISSAVTGITRTTATLNGIISAHGGRDPISHGFEYSFDSGLAAILATTALGQHINTGTFTSTIASLTCGTTYYSRPYATNVTGTGYASIQNFMTSVCDTPPIVAAPAPVVTRTSGTSAARRSANVNTTNTTKNTTNTGNAQSGIVVQTPGNVPTPSVVISDTGPSSATAPSTPQAISRLVELFITMGIIPADKVEQARSAIPVSTPATSPVSTISTPASASPASSFGRNLQLHDTGPDVVALQNALISKGFLAQNLNGGTFGPMTLNALVEYQKSISLPATGYFGPLTQSQLAR